jgi:Tol biopolymer transport system component
LKSVRSVTVVAALALVATQLAAATTTATNGSLVAFTSLRGGVASLYVANSDGSGQHRLTAAGAGAYQGDAAWSPDGSRIAFTCGNFELCVASADGSAVTRLTTSTWPTTWSYDFEPAWSPDGTSIVFSGKRGGATSALWIVAADGTGLRKLVDGAGDERHPEWSPDGTRILYGRDTTTGSDLHLINPDGSGARQLTTTAKAYEQDPDWSPDGTTIAYERSTDSSLESDVWLMSAAGGGYRRLGAGEEPSWAPDGTFLHISGPQALDDELFTIRPDGSGRTRVTTSRGGDYTPQLQPAGVTVTLPPAPATPLAAVHPDARTVGVFLARSAQLSRDLAGLGSNDGRAILLAAKALARDAGAGRAAVAATRPVSARGKRVRTDGMATFVSARASALTLLEMFRIAPQGKKVQKRLNALNKQYQSQVETMYKRLAGAYTASGL